MIAAVLHLALPQTRGRSYAGFKPRNFRAHDGRDHLEGGGVAHAGREEQDHEHRKEAQNACG